MNKKFNVTGLCIPDRHYMVDISTQLDEIKKLIDGEEYFTINRGRQYGKTTTLNALKQMLDKDIRVPPGESIAYTALNPVIDIAAMFGFIKNNNKSVAIANRIFETVLYDLFLSTEEMKGNDIYKASLQDANQFTLNGHLNMRFILERFVTHFNDLYAGNDETFLEEEGRKYFLLYLRPIINGIGNYYIESRTRYMLSFNFNKQKQIGVHEIIIGDKVIVEAVV